jgi:hypothetical protein
MYCGNSFRNHTSPIKSEVLQRTKTCMHEAAEKQTPESRSYTQHYRTAGDSPNRGQDTKRMVEQFFSGRETESTK